MKNLSYISGIIAAISVILAVVSSTFFVDKALFDVSALTNDILK